MRHTRKCRAMTRYAGDSREYPCTGNAEGNGFCQYHNTRTPVPPMASYQRDIREDNARADAAVSRFEMRRAWRRHGGEG